MLSIKNLFAAVGLAGLTALSGCDQQSADVKPTQGALDAKCPAQATQAQKAACIGQATTQSMYALNQTYLHEHERLSAICMKPTRQVLANDPDRADELIYTQAYNVMECLDAVEAAAPVASRNYVRTIAQNVRNAFARSDIGQHPSTYVMDAQCPINPTEDQKDNCVSTAYIQSHESFRMALAAMEYNISSFNTSDDMARACLTSPYQPVEQMADNTKKCFEMLEEDAPSTVNPEIKDIAQGARRGLERVGF